MTGVVNITPSAFTSQDYFLGPNLSRVDPGFYVDFVPFQMPIEGEQTEITQQGSLRATDLQSWHTTGRELLIPGRGASRPLK